MILGISFPKRPVEKRLERSYPVLMPSVESFSLPLVGTSFSSAHFSGIGGKR